MLLSYVRIYFIHTMWDKRFGKLICLLLKCFCFPDAPCTPKQCPSLVLAVAQSTNLRAFTVSFYFKDIGKGMERCILGVWMVLFMTVGVYSDRQCWVSLKDQIPTGRNVHIFFKCVCVRMCTSVWVMLAPTKPRPGQRSCCLDLVVHWDQECWDRVRES